ncbi:hypothetical protein D8674_041459 [Pyrus ussuriensis x Pyrus communis]|uniref:Uncharacterized protein n=1 Tax=Pyrus ussuriensis x Pyrus communis TaxID=2448454 RepID=A0A5N5I9H0_9ROSA|nr:hypothetical protein D8674_037801 [Pyrus ussuriensis x Pyrus communis]KAB2634340.1 hypothetical protein D8674_041459 [Pyrus ussuriensis x Pyrus communis]
MYSDRRAPIKNWIPNLLPSFTFLFPTGMPMPNPHRGQVLGVCEGDLDLVSTFSGRSLASSEDVTTAAIWFMQVEVAALILLGPLVT